MKKLLALTLALTASAGTSYAQQNEQALRGVVVEANDKGHLTPLPGVVVYWMGTDTYTETDTNGVFTLSKIPGHHTLVAVMTGFQNDTVRITESNKVTILMRSSGILEEVVIADKIPDTYISYLDAMKTQIMTENELFKAACCNLSESFETNPSVDVSFSDAVTGTKQIQMLGLSGSYTSFLSENMPGLRGFAGSMGLSLVPGTWIESIQVTKGTGSVVNGPESMAGQINTELKKPEGNEQWLGNAYLNATGRTELNFNTSQRINAKWSTSTMSHYSNRPLRFDMNNDGFMDMPTGEQINLAQRLKYDNGKGLMIQAAIKGVTDSKTGGEMNFDRSIHRNTSEVFGTTIATRRAELPVKIGYVFPQKKYKSMGLQLSATHHRQESLFGRRSYTGEQNSVYANFIYQSIIFTSAHKFRAGGSLYADRYAENFEATPFNRSETMPGAFAEYTFAPGPKFTAVAGLRGDYNSLYRTAFATPRLHLRYALSPNTTMRVSGGSGVRTANVLTEAIGYMASSRVFVLPAHNVRRAYGLPMEKAWNYGLSVTHDFRLNYRSGTVGIDLYRTEFENKAVMDLDQAPGMLHIYALNGASYANSLQVDWNYEPLKRTELRAAYRLVDAYTDFGEKRLFNPLIPAHRAFVNMAYTTRNKWKTDATIQWLGKARVPSTASNPSAYQRADYSEAYILINAQLTKEFKAFDWYVGVENMTNYRQPNAIIAADAPFGPHFDSSLMWAPVFGRMIYTGFRWIVKRKNG